MAYISCENLCFSYDDGQVINNIALNIEKGECVGILGANGAGKSTLMQIFTGLNRGFSGSVSIDGTALGRKSIKEIRKKLGYVFQDFDAQLFMPTAYEDVCFGLESMSLTADEIHARADRIFGALGIDKLKNKYTHRMSGGEKKLVSLAGVLVMEPECILLDEPTVGLDPKNRANIINIIRSLDITKIIATHDLDMALEICERVIIMNKGTITAQGRAQDILLDREIMEKNDLALPICAQNMADLKK